MKKNIKLTKDQIDYISEISKDIIQIDFKKYNNIASAFNKFYSIMRKYGIKNGTKRKGEQGVLCSNFEWTCFEMQFIEQYCSYIRTYRLFNSDIPKDLQHY